MITSTRILTTESTAPYANLAAEEILLNCLPPGQAVLFLWQNAHTVVIGAGQNAWRECRVSLLEAEGGRLARRASGGGAVYHDLGNLNFSLILPRGEYDVSRQAGVILAAAREVGVDAQLSGRNDITAGGRKFSGNAFRLLAGSALHHGTLLINSDMDKVKRYLSVDKEKLAAKGVQSVPARVVNISELCGADVPDVRRAVISAFRAEYGDGEEQTLNFNDLPGFEEVAAKYASWNWRLGASPVGDLRAQRRFDWGHVEIIARVAHGALGEVRVYTDSMDETLSARLSLALGGCRLNGRDLAARAMDAGEAGVAEWLREIY